MTLQVHSQPAIRRRWDDAELLFGHARQGNGDPSTASGSRAG